jgi:hypothetical protein
MSGSRFSARLLPIVISSHCRRQLANFGGLAGQLKILAIRWQIASEWRQMWELNRSSLVAVLVANSENLRATCNTSMVMKSALDVGLKLSEVLSVVSFRDSNQ